jgi:hypothetical protein
VKRTSLLLPFVLPGALLGACTPAAVDPPVAVVADPDDVPDPGDVGARECDPGNKRIHRLNRTEYDATTRDLLGVDLALAQSFPADDVGYGFDNVADVLSTSSTPPPRRSPRR